MGSKVVKLAQRTQDFIEMYLNNGRLADTRLGKVDITRSPWHEGYQNVSLQKSPEAQVPVSLCAKGKILEGCGGYIYSTPSSPEQVPFSATMTVVSDKRSIPKQYRDMAVPTIHMDKMKKKFGDSFANVYYNLQDAAVISSLPENVRKASFDRFVGSQVKEVLSMYEKESDEFKLGITSALTAQLVSDYETGEYLNYAEDVIGQFPGGVALEEKRKAKIKEHDDAKREKVGLTDKAVEMAFGGSVKSGYAKDAGIFVVEFPAEAKGAQSSVGKALMDNVDDIIDYAENLMGTPEDNRGQKLFVSKDMVDETKGVAKVAILFRGLSSENEGEVEAAVQRACRDCIEDNTSLRYPRDFDFGSVMPALESQVENAVERYTSETGKWMSPKSLRKPIAIELNESLITEKQTTVDKQPGE